ncbi:MAG: hypothetical protein GF320_19900, partial [Armatimonadia bacterium]|nr:hypothetical protein [Armatimonadia bacterium]
MDRHFRRHAAGPCAPRQQNSWRLRGVDSLGRSEPGVILRMSIHSRTRPVPLLAALLVAAGVAHGQGNELVVTTTVPGGPGSLAAAINQANESPGATITFAIPEADEGYDDATGLWTLTVAEALTPIIAEGITIDGGGRVALVAAAPSVEHGIVLVSPRNVIRGLCLGGFQTGLALYGGGAIGNRVEDCLIGTDPAGQQAVPCDTGLALLEGASDNVVTGCVISGNRQLGVYIAGRETTGNAILDCRIGCDAQGTRRLPNAMGIMVTRSPENRVGAPGQGNVISGNDGIGILLVGKWTEGNRIEGNHIGVDAAGTGLLYNTIGIVLKSLANGNLVGGSAEGEGNLITGNLEIGAYVEAADGNIFRGNLIGTDVTGTHAVSEGELIQGNGIEFNTVAKD